MHSKLMLLFHPEYLRVVVPTANLIPVDWGEYDIMENVSYIVGNQCSEGFKILTRTDCFYYRSAFENKRKIRGGPL